MNILSDKNPLRLGYFPGLDDAQIETDQIVQKSKPLLSLWQSPLTLAEFKILDAYLARIDSHKPNKRKVRFEKGELESILGVTQIKLPDLEKRIQHLGIMVTIEETADSFTSVALFEQAECVLDERGLWTVDLECTKQAMKYIFNIDDIGYLRYRLRSIIQLNSRYSYMLFLYLEHNRFRNAPWEISVNDLRQVLGCTSDFYQSYKEFNKNILHKCAQELTAKTDCRFTYQPIRKGRAVKRVRFTLEPLIVELDEPQQDEAANSNDASSSSSSGKPGKPSTRELLISALCMPGEERSEFSEEQIAEIFAYLTCIPLSKLPANGPGCFDVNLQRYHYLLNKFAELNRRAMEQTIKSRFAYFLAMLKADFE